MQTKDPDGNFIGVLIMNFFPDWESEIVNQSGLQKNFVRKLMLLNTVLNFM